MNNMRIWGRFSTTPKEAQKNIDAGRLKGFTDINPMWRFKALTEQFGPCGIGWKLEIKDYHIEQGAGDERRAFVLVNLYYREPDGTWSEPVPGFGGASFVSREKNGPYTNDECYKMALSDAIGTACKALGISHDCRNRLLRRIFYTRLLSGNLPLSFDAHTGSAYIRTAGTPCPDRISPSLRSRACTLLLSGIRC